MKMLCGYMFGDKMPNEKTLPKARALFYLLYEQLTDEKAKENATAKRNTKHFSFPLSYAKFIEALNDIETGLLIKQCCNYMFGTSPLTDEEEKQIDGYFSFIKTSLTKSKRQSENAKRHKEKRENQSITLDRIRSDFPEIRGSLNANNIILDSVNLNELYEFIRDNEDIRTLSMYGIVERFRQQKGI